MKLKKIGDKITVDIDVTYGTINVEFVIIDILSSYSRKYLVYAQQRIGVIHNKADGSWELLGDLDLTYFIHKHE